MAVIDAASYIQNPSHLDHTVSAAEPSGRKVAASLLDRLLQLSREAAQIGEYEVAYHAIMAALHAADRARSLSGIDRIMRLAEEQENAIESEAPPHRLSSAQARRRGTHSVYQSLPVHAEALRVRLKSAGGSLD